MSTKARMGPSESEINAQALMRRSAPYTAASEMSFRIKWDASRREPLDLRDAVRLARRAYQDEVPTRLHEGPDSIGEGGTPRMTAKAEGYIMGSHSGSDRTDPDQLVSYYHAPFRACLETLARGDGSMRRRAAIVSHITIGSQGPVHAAITEGAHPLDAKLVAWDALCSFLRSMTDMRLHLPRVEEREGAVA